jgi:hypothetical protein
VYLCPLAILVAGLAFDGATTWACTSRHGWSVEVHPAMVLMIRLLGPAVGVLAGTVVRTACLLVVAATLRFWTGGLIALAGVFYLAAGVHNLWQLAP